MLRDIAAVIVTRNRADKLMRVLDALEKQTAAPEMIVIVDNASTDDTQKRVYHRAETMPALRYLKLAQNMGGAGGFKAGIKYACAQGANYIWTSDDDCYPQPDAIQILLDSMQDFADRYGDRPAFACSRVDWTNGEICEMNVPAPVWDWSRFLEQGSPYTLVSSCSFVSMLIPRWAILYHGLPISEYFIWFDDVEYSRRLSRSHPGIYCHQSRVIHDLDVNRGVNFGMVNNKNLWKFSYGARNEASFHYREGGLPGLLAFAHQTRRQMRGGAVPRRLRYQIYRAVCAGFFLRPKIDTI